MHHMKSLTTNLKTIITSLVLFAAVPVAFAWTVPPANPPKDNVAAPVNVSNTDQNKQGKLGLGGLAIFGKFQLIDGTQGVGKVLVSDADGKASWAPISPSGVVSNTNGGGGTQAEPGWPNMIKCVNPNDSAESLMFYLYGATKDQITYINWQRDPTMSILFSKSDGSMVSASPSLTRYGTISATCLKNINEFGWFN